jgi:hypothetical protein
MTAIATTVTVKVSRAPQIFALLCDFHDRVRVAKDQGEEEIPQSEKAAQKTAQSGQV